MHQPVKRGAVIKPDLPWDSSRLQTVARRLGNPGQKLFKLWMITSTTIHRLEGRTDAASKGGIRWTKPVLGQYAINGSKDNNFVTVDANLGWPANAMENVLYDPYDPDPSRRYKGLGHRQRREPLVSADGIQWRRLDLTADPFFRRVEPQLRSADPSFHCDVQNGARPASSGHAGNEHGFRARLAPVLGLWHRRRRSGAGSESDCGPAGGSQAIPTYLR